MQCLNIAQTSCVATYTHNNWHYTEAVEFTGEVVDVVTKEWELWSEIQVHIHSEITIVSIVELQECTQSAQETIKQWAKHHDYAYHL